MMNRSGGESIDDAIDHEVVCGEDAAHDSDESLAAPLRVVSSKKDVVLIKSSTVI